MVSQRERGLEAAVEPAGAGVLGSGIVDRRDIGSVEAAETVGFSDRKGDLTADDDRWGR